MNKVDRALVVLIYTLVVAIVVMTMFMIGLLVCGNVPNNRQRIYSTVFRIEGIRNDTVYVRDCMGNIFSFDGVEDWVVGDYMSAVMDSNGTPTIDDDRILSTKFQRLDFFDRR